MFLQSSYREDIISGMVQQVFLLDLVLIRKMVCGSSVQTVLPDFCTAGVIKRCWLVIAGLVSAPILPRLPDVMNSEIEKILYVLGQDLIVYDGSHKLLV